MEQVKIKYEATKAIVGKFPNNGMIATLMALLSKVLVPLDWPGYCALPEADQLVWELRVDVLNQEIFYLMNLKNKNTKKDLRMAHSQVFLWYPMMDARCHAVLLPRSESSSSSSSSTTG